MIELPITERCFLRDLRGDSIVAMPLRDDRNMNPLFRVTIADGENVHTVYRFVSSGNFHISSENDNYLLCFTSLRFESESYMPESDHEILLDPTSVEEWFRNRNLATPQVPMEIER